MVFNICVNLAKRVFNFAQGLLWKVEKSLFLLVLKAYYIFLNYS